MANTYITQGSKPSLFSRILGAVTSPVRDLFRMTAYAANPPSLSQATSQILYGSPSYTPPTSTYRPPAPAPTGPSSVGITNVPAPTGPPASNQPSFDINQLRNQTMSDEEAARRAAEERIRQGIESSYQPIFTELDRQVGLLPGQKEEFQKQISNLATSQVANVGTEQARRLAQGEATKGTEIQTSAGSLRNLESDVRNLLQAESYYLGARGAGDSSATPAASEAITREALRQRSNILTTRDTALSAIDQKMEDVKTLGSQQLNNIDTWKNNKLFDVTQFFVQRLDALNSQKVNAQGRKAEALANLIANTENEFLGRLKQLDDAVFNYKTSVATWQQQRAADLEDYKTKLGLAARYQTTPQTQYQAIIDNFGNILRFNPATGTAEPVITGILPSGGIGTTKKPEEQNQQPTSLNQTLLGQ